MGAQDEVARALRWGRVMPAWQAGTERCQLSAEYLEDSWNFAPMETTFSTVLGKEIRQQAPARVARGLALPEVRGSEDVPYVIASRHPNGACAVATLGRVDAQTGWRVPRAQVVMDVGDARGPVGVFGHLAQLEIRSRGIRATSRVWGQDLLANTAEEITGSVQVRAGAIVISGELIERVGLAGATPGDRSEPGLALAWE